MAKVIELNVGEMRAQCAYKSADTKVQLVSKDPELGRMLSNLRVVCAYPDTTDAQGNWIGTFKIEVESI
jgi:hypothetical protein